MNPEEIMALIDELRLLAEEGTEGAAALNKAALLHAREEFAAAEKWARHAERLIGPEAERAQRAGTAAARIRRGAPSPTAGATSSRASRSATGAPTLATLPANPADLVGRPRGADAGLAQRSEILGRIEEVETALTELHPSVVTGKEERAVAAAFNLTAAAKKEVGLGRLYNADRLTASAAIKLAEVESSLRIDPNRSRFMRSLKRFGAWVREHPLLAAAGTVGAGFAAYHLYLSTQFILGGQPRWEAVKNLGYSLIPHADKSLADPRETTDVEFHDFIAVSEANLADFKRLREDLRQWNSTWGWLYPAIRNSYAGYLIAAEAQDRSAREQLGRLEAERARNVAKMGGGRSEGAGGGPAAARTGRTERSPELEALLRGEAVPEGKAPGPGGTTPPR